MYPAMSSSVGKSDNTQDSLAAVTCRRHIGQFRFCPLLRKQEKDEELGEGGGSGMCAIDELLPQQLTIYQCTSGRSCEHRAG